MEQVSKPVIDASHTAQVLISIILEMKRGTHTNITTFNLGRAPQIQASVFALMKHLKL